MKLFRAVFIVIVATELSGMDGSAIASLFRDRSAVAENISSRAGFSGRYIRAGNFTLKAYQKFKEPSGSLRVYIEGDGRAWKKRTRLSDDPTPSNPMALRLAAADPSANILYIARPGQFPLEGALPCDPTYWSERRFSPEVVHAFNEAIDIVKRDARAQKIELAGYSGGGALAVLIAARRNDVVGIRTVAANLDHVRLTAHHHTSPLKGSLNPVDEAGKVAYIPQRHFAGGKDRVVPPFIVESFAAAAARPDTVKVIIIPGLSHSGKWQDRWPELLMVRD